ncbi:flagellar hook basal-body protein [Deferribacter thermophilus]|uniref:flagellar hook-basal body complex protein n=1 Tax=Deferribacter thermophilus TaxID=53573 RepID=UPI003C207529
MIKGLYSSLSALNAAIKRVDNNAYNIANINTPGFKRVLSYNNTLSKGGVNVFTIKDNDKQGYLIYTGRNLDLAINGEGFFKLLNGNGEEVFTRFGHFSVDKNGNIVNPNGDILFSAAKGKDVRITLDGSIYIDNEPLGKIELFDTNGNKVSNNQYEIMPGYLEASNVDVAREIVDMIVSKNYFEANLKSTKIIDEMLGKIIDNFA